VLSDSAFRLEDAAQPAYIILRHGRTYFENREKMNETRARPESLRRLRRRPERG